MQFIDQAPAYKRKSITFAKAVAQGRARVKAETDADRLAVCFRPDLKTAIAFDMDIEDRLDFNALSTSEKADLLIDELLPKFCHPDLLPLTGRSAWHVRFVIDGTVERTLRFDDRGLHDVSHEDAWPEIEIETDILTLLAMLRAEIARFHMTKPRYPEVPRVQDGEEVMDEDVTGW
ncbi:MAG: hypothetical protein KDK24_14835 [Pseudooceanicola sp.]|nr:hypothetical protein [Pseudooceanicola sp.]